LPRAPQPNSLRCRAKPSSNDPEQTLGMASKLSFGLHLVCERSRNSANHPRHLGGNVFPMIFIGGTAGVLVHLLIPDIPLSLSVAAMMAAVPGAFLNAPLSLTLIAAATVGLDALAVIPVTVAVVTAYLFFSVVRYLAARRSEVSAPA